MTNTIRMTRTEMEILDTLAANQESTTEEIADLMSSQPEITGPFVGDLLEAGHVSQCGNTFRALIVLEDARPVLSGLGGVR